jgi:hypothetical protein
LSPSRSRAEIFEKIRSHQGIKPRHQFLKKSGYQYLNSVSDQCGGKKFSNLLLPSQRHYGTIWAYTSTATPY